MSPGIGKRRVWSRVRVIAGRAVLCCGVLMASPALCGEDLRTAIRTALETNPEVGIVLEGQRAVQYELKQAEGGYLPEVDLRVAAGPGLTNTRITRDRIKDPGEGDTIVLGEFESSLIVSQPLFDGFESYYEIRRSRARLVSASRRIRETADAVALEAVKVYLDAQRQTELTALARENVTRHERMLDLVERKAAGGAATIADIQQARSRLAAAETTVTQAHTRLRDAIASYARIVGEDPRGLTRPVLPLWALPASEEDAIALALDNNTTVTVLRADEDAARMAYEVTQAPFYPKVDLQLRGNYDENLEGTVGADYEGSAKVVMTYNLFRGFEDKNARLESKARIAEARQRLNRAVRLTEEEVRLSWNSLTSAQERVAAQTREVAANDRVRQTYRQQFDLGGRSLLELLDSENELFLARATLISSEFAEMFAVFRILSATGTLLSALDVPLVEEARSEYDMTPPREIDPALRHRASQEEGPVPVAERSVLDPSLYGTDPTASEVYVPAPSEPSLLEGQVLDPAAIINPSASSPPVPVEADGSGANAVLDPAAVLDPTRSLPPAARGTDEAVGLDDGAGNATPPEAAAPIDDLRLPDGSRLVLPGSAGLWDGDDPVIPDGIDPLPLRDTILNLAMSRALQKTPGTPVRQAGRTLRLPDLPWAGEGFGKDTRPEGKPAPTPDHGPYRLAVGTNANPMGSFTFSIGD